MAPFEFTPTPRGSIARYKVALAPCSCLARLRPAAPPRPPPAPLPPGPRAQPGKRQPSDAILSSPHESFVHSSKLLGS